MTNTEWSHRVTEHYKTVSDILTTAEKPMSAMEIWAATNGKVGLVTVYRILQRLEDLGELEVTPPIKAKRFAWKEEV